MVTHFDQWTRNSTRLRVLAGLLAVLGLVWVWKFGGSAANTVRDTHPTVLDVLVDKPPPSSLPFDDELRALDLQTATSDAVRELADLRIFATGLVGFTAAIPSAAKPFNTVLADTKADKAFHALLQRQALPIEARLYGLCGLYFADRNAFEQQCQKWEASTMAVRTQSGCIIVEKELGSLIMGNGGATHAISNGSATKALWGMR